MNTAYTVAYGCVMIGRADNIVRSLPFEELTKEESPNNSKGLIIDLCYHAG